MPRWSISTSNILSTAWPESTCVTNATKENRFMKLNYSDRLTCLPGTAWELKGSKRFYSCPWQRVSLSLVPSTYHVRWWTPSSSWTHYVVISCITFTVSLLFIVSVFYFLLDRLLQDFRTMARIYWLWILVVHRLIHFPSDFYWTAMVCWLVKFIDSTDAKVLSWRRKTFQNTLFHLFACLCPDTELADLLHKLNQW